MTETLYAAGALGSTLAFALAAAIGVFFGFFLEQAGFGSSRKLAGIFYLRDMTVLKVMFTALLTAMLGLAYLEAFGWVQAESLHLLPTIYGAQAVGGLVFGLGFVMGGWCPGTAAAGLAAGRDLVSDHRRDRLQPVQPRQILHRPFPQARRALVVQIADVWTHHRVAARRHRHRALHLRPRRHPSVRRAGER